MNFQKVIRSIADLFDAEEVLDRLWKERDRAMDVDTSPEGYQEIAEFYYDDIDYRETQVSLCEDNARWMMERYFGFDSLI